MHKKCVPGILFEAVCSCLSKGPLSVDELIISLTFFLSATSPTASEEWSAGHVWEHTVIIFIGVYNEVYLLSDDEWVCLAKDCWMMIDRLSDRQAIFFWGNARRVEV